MTLWLMVHLVFHLSNRLANQMLAGQAVSSENETKTLVSSNRRLQSPAASNTFSSGIVVMGAMEQKTKNVEAVYIMQF